MSVTKIISEEEIPKSKMEDNELLKNIREYDFIDNGIRIELTKKMNNTKSDECYVKLLTNKFLRDRWYKISKDNYIFFNDGEWLDKDANGFRSWISSIFYRILEECHVNIKGLGYNLIGEKKYTSLFKKFGELNKIQSLISCNHPSETKDFNKAKNILLFKDNVVFDMKTKETKYQDQSIKMTIKLPFESDILELTDRDKFCKEYFKSLFNCNKTAKSMINVIYTAISGNKMRYLFILWGEGRNGKSFFLNILNGIFGEWVSPISEKVFIKRNNQSTHNDEMVDCCKKRIGYFCEPPSGSELCEDTIKKISGDDGVTIRDLGKTTYVDTPTITLFMSCNTPPTLSNDTSMQDRLIAFHFCNRFKKDSEKEEELKEHLPYLLSYILRKGKLIDNPKMTDNMREAKNFIEYQSDIVEQYLTDSGDYEKDKDSTFNQTTFKKDIMNWAKYTNLKRSDLDKIGMNNLYKTLDKKGYNEVQRTSKIKNRRSGLKRTDKADIDENEDRYE